MAKGDSPLRDKLGQQVLAPCFTIIDDPHHPFSGGAEIDSDGISTRKQVLFERGVLRRFLYDLDSAGLAGAEPTGNRNCSPYVAYVPPGQRSHEELIKGVDDGILLYNLIG